MDAFVLKRLRADAGVIAAAGVFDGDLAIDHTERKSDAESAFPAAIQTVVAGNTKYNQDGAMGTRTWRLRWETFSVGSDEGAVELAHAIVAALQPEGEFEGARFGRGFLVLERSGGAEDVEDQRLFRRIIDMEITATY